MLEDIFKKLTHHNILYNHLDLRLENKFSYSAASNNNDVDFNSTKWLTRIVKFLRKKKTGSKSISEGGLCRKKVKRIGIEMAINEKTMNKCKIM